MSINNGADLEEKVFNTITNLVNSGELGLISSHCKVFRHKEYFSKDRDANIITDISIEVFINETDGPYLIWIWECKDYNHAVPVDDIEEFHSKLEQIGADKTKGTIITSLGSFQRGCLKYAKSKGIGLARLMPTSNVHFVLACLSSDRSYRDKAEEALTTQDFIAWNCDFFIKDNNEMGYSLENYITNVLKRFNHK